jgi:hypothetical protein
VRSSTALLPALLAVWFSLLTAACGAPERTLIFHPAPDVNQGRHFYVLIRTVDEKDFFADSYQKIAGLVFPAAKDASVLATGLLWPGKSDKIKVKIPNDQPFAVYLLFTTPGEPWKLLLNAPLEKEYEFMLEGSKVFLQKPMAEPQ